MKFRVWVFLDKTDIEMIQELIKQKRYDSISQFIRKSVREQLDKEYKIKVY